MAIAIRSLETTLRLQVLVGTNDKEEPIFKLRSFKNVRAEAEHEAIYDVAQGLGGLMKYPLNEVQLLQNNSLIEE